MKLSHFIYLLILLCALRCNDGGKVASQYTKSICDTLYVNDRFIYPLNCKISKFNSSAFRKELWNNILDKSKDQFLNDSFLGEKTVILRGEMDLSDSIYLYNDKMYIYKNELLIDNNLEIYFSRNQYVSKDFIECELKSLKLPDSLSRFEGFLFLKNNNRYLTKTFDRKVFSMVDILYIVENYPKDKFLFISIMAPLSDGSFLSKRLIIIVDLIKNRIIFDGVIWPGN